MPRVEEPVDDRLNFGAGEEGVGDILCDVGSVASRDGACSKSRISGSRLSGADMGEVGLAANGSMKNAPRRNYEGGVDGRIEERKPDTGEGSAEVWGREVASEGHAMYFFFFFFLGTGANYNSRNRKRNQPTKDKGQETKDRTKCMRVGRGGRGCR